MQYDNGSASNAISAQIFKTLPAIIKSDMTREEEINIVLCGGIHVVILGAGASIASTLRNSEINGKVLPAMNNIVDVVGLENIVKSLPKQLRNLKDDFEKLYSQLFSLPEFNEQKIEIETRVYNYFQSLKLPDCPTIYDYLILSLRNNKDVIATFNWDPFLYQAYVRNQELVKSPGILHLHGNVALGYCKSDQTIGPAGYKSKHTLKEWEPTRLLYPVEKKDYNTDHFINGQWEALQDELKVAKRVTVFGYRAPESDIEAITLMQQAWGGSEKRAMEQFELIDVRPEEDVKSSWKNFIHSHHYNYHTNFFESSIARHPRRSVESYHHWSSPFTPNDVFQDGNLVPSDFRTLEEMWEWYKPLIEAEKKYYDKK